MYFKFILVYINLYSLYITMNVSEGKGIFELFMNKLVYSKSVTRSLIEISTLTREMHLYRYNERVFGLICFISLSNNLNLPIYVFDVGKACIVLRIIRFYWIKKSASDDSCASVLHCASFHSPHKPLDMRLYLMYI